MTLGQLRYIEAVARHGSFSDAARECLVAQPTLSLQIQKLEQEIGTELFDRSKSPIKTTVFGRLVVEQARTVLREAEKIEELFREHRDDPSGLARIGIIPTISNYLLPRILGKLRHNFPAIDFRIYELPTAQIMDRLESETLDLGILATPLQNKSLVEDPLYYEPFVAYFPEDYTGARKNIKMEDIQDMSLILLGDEHCFRNQALKICSKNSHGHIECGSFETIKKLVDQGMGMTLLPQLAADLKHPRVGILAEPQPAREVSLVYRRGFFKKRILKALQETILAEIPVELLTRRNHKLVGIEPV